MKFEDKLKSAGEPGRLLCWRRGLKSSRRFSTGSPRKSPPLLEAWIEIFPALAPCRISRVASFVGGVD